MGDPVNFKGKGAMVSALDSAYSAKSGKGFEAAREELDGAFKKVCSAYKKALKKGGGPGKAEAAAIRSALDNAFSDGKKAKKAEGALKKILKAMDKKWEAFKKELEDKKAKKKASVSGQIMLFEEGNPAEESEANLMRTAKKKSKKMRRMKKRKPAKFRGKAQFYSAWGRLNNYEREEKKLSAKIKRLKDNKKLKEDTKKTRMNALLAQGKKLQKEKKRMQMSLMKAFKVVINTYRGIAKKEKKSKRDMGKLRGVLKIFNSDLSKRRIMKAKGKMKRLLGKMKALAKAAVESTKRMKKGFVNNATLRKDIIRIAYLSNRRDRNLLLPLIVRNGKVASAEGLRERTIRLASNHPHLRNGLRPFLVPGEHFAMERNASAAEDDRRVREAIIRYAYQHEEHRDVLLGVLKGELDY